MSRWSDDWPPGPWDTESDEATAVIEGLQCLVRRAPIGVFCGYVEIPPGHPLHGLDCSAEPVRALEVHGGVTSAGYVAPDTWAIGFHCGHARKLDQVPKLAKHPLSAFATYRTIGYAIEETAYLARQVAALAPSGLLH